MNKANTKDITTLEGNGRVVKKLLPRHLAFCRSYTTKGENFLNATKTYALMYDKTLPLRPDGTVDINSNVYLMCKANSGRLMARPDVRQQIQIELLGKFNDLDVDARTSEIIIGGRDVDSIQAIKIYNDLKQRVVRRMEVVSVARPYASMTDEELRNIIDV